MTRRGPILAVTTTGFVVAALLTGAAPAPTAFSRALSSIGADGGSTRLAVTPGQWAVDTATIVPGHVHLDVQSGAHIKKASGGTLTINGPFTATLTQEVFSGFSPGDIKFGPGVREISAGWFGAKCDGVHDDTAALLAAAVAVSGAKSQANPWAGFSSTLYAPPGTCMLGKTMLFDRALGVTFRGAGRWTTTIQWKGKAGVPMVQFLNSRQCTIQDMDIHGLPAAPPSSGIDFLVDTTESGLTWAPTGYLIENVGIGATSPKSLTYGVSFTQGAGINANNDYGTFRKVNFGNYIKAGVWIGHSESRGHAFRDCAFTGNGGQHGLVLPNHDDGEDRGRGGSATVVENCYFANHSVSDIQLGWPNDPVSILSSIFEGSRRFIVVPDPTNYPHWSQILRIEGNTFACNGIDADLQAIQIRNYGPVVFRANRLCSVRRVRGVDIGVPRIVMSNQDHLGRAEVVGNAWDVAGSATSFFDPVELGPGWTMRRENNIYRTEVQDTCDHDGGVCGPRYAADPILWPDAGPGSWNMRPEE